MIGIYFSGTGNSRHAVEVFLKKYGESAKAYSIEDAKITNIPKMLNDFIDQNQNLWNGKKVVQQGTIDKYLYKTKFIGR